MPLSSCFNLLTYILDMDECKFNISDCDVNANCTNTFGSYKCTCKLGYIGDGRSCLGKYLIDISVYN